jgi:uncharacterized membrane protein YfcA
MGHRNAVFRSSADVYAALTVPVLAVVPVMLTAAERRHRRRRRLFRRVMVAIGVMLCVAAAAGAWLLSR